MVGAHEARIRELVVDLHVRGAVVAVLSEPRLAPGAIWPGWAGYSYYGERSALPDTVAVLIMQEAEPSIEILEGFGDARALWVAVPAAEGGAGGVLVLGVYGFQPNYGVALRRAFWVDRLAEWRELRARPRFRGWELAFAGDFNLHFGQLGAPTRARSSDLIGTCCIG